MNILNENIIDCPYCGEHVDILVDCSMDHQDYIEDCHVCCRPMVIKVALSTSREPEVSVYHENEA